MKICCFILLGLLFCFAVFSVGFDCKKYSLNDPDAGSSGDEKPKPEAPSNLVATAVSMAQINLSWKDNSKVEDGFKIERSPDGTNYYQLTTIGSNIVSYSDTGLTTDTLYHYRVRAYNKEGDSLYSNGANAITLVTPTLSNSGGGSWTHYSSVTITNLNGISLTDYQVAITLTTISFGSPYSNIKADGADIRFTSSESAPTTEMSYWIELFSNTGNSNVWVKIPSLPAGEFCIYMYYGNISATSSSNGDNTFEFFDDFNSTVLNASKWNTINSGLSKSISNSIFHASGSYWPQDIADGDFRGYQSAATYGLGYAMRARVLTDHGEGASYNNNEIGFGKRAYSTSTSSFVDLDYCGGDSYGYVGIANGSVGNYITWTRSTQYNIWDFIRKPNQDHRAIIGTLLDNTFTANAPSDSLPLTLGSANWSTTWWAYYDYYVDYILVRKCADIEPTVSLAQAMPVAYWKFDETSGITATDSSALGNDGTVSGATWSSGALSFDGVDDYVDAGNSSTLNITGQMTVQAWFKTTITGTGMAILSNYDCYGPIFPPNNKKGYILFLNNLGAVQFDIYKYQSADAYDSVTTIDSFNDGVWHQAVGVFPANGVDRVRIYVDGVLQDVTRAGSVKTDCTASTISFSIGRENPSNYGPAGNYFNGQLDDVKIYNYVRSADDILSSYNSYKPTMLANTPWPIFQHDNRHSGLSPYTGSMTNTLKWFYTTGGVIEYPAPVIDTDGTIYVGSRDCKLHAVNPNGTIKWSYMTAGWVCGSATVSLDGTIYVGSADRKLHAINPNGTVKWTYLTGGSTSSSPAIATDGTIYMGTGSGDNKLYAINPNGSLKWTYPAGYIDKSIAIGADGTIYIGSQNSKLYVINPDGSLKWSYTTGDIIEASPSIGADGTIYVGCWDNKIYAINPNGSLKWTYLTGGSIESGVAIGADGTIYVGCYDEKLYAINPDGSFKWSYTTGGDISSSPAIGADGVIYVGSEDNKIYAINSNGTLKWSYTTGGFVDSSPSIGADGTVYVGSRDGKLYAIGP